MHDVRTSLVTRRGLIGGGAALLGANMLPTPASAQAARFRRFEISDPAMPARVLASYKAGVARMLTLPPSDPRNWYRNAIVHVLDCPHGNWWFLAWHRAYLGWFEATVRELSGDSEFALPYWDWSKAPRVPAAMFDGVLDPNNGAFIGTFTQFRQRFQPPVTAMFNAFSPAQKTQLARRGLTAPANLWPALQSAFLNRPNARGLTSTNPDLDADTKLTVDPRIIRDALRTTRFAGSGAPGQPAGFHSAKARNHSTGSVQGILESQPHNNVHGAMGGGGGAFMQRFLSPVDPIFFLHHANLDRLWDVWTRRQTALNQPVLPQGADLAAWSDERFLFFSDRQGQPVTKVKAGDYTSMTTFEYDYAPGTGENEIPATGTVVATRPTRTFGGPVAEAVIGAPTAAGAVVPVPAPALQATAEGPPRAVAEVTLNLGHADDGRRFRVLVSPGDGAAPVAAGTITVFGHAGHGPTTFSIPLPADLGGTATGNVPLDIRVVPIGPARPTGEAVGATPPPQVGAIRVVTD